MRLWTVLLASFLFFSPARGEELSLALPLEEAANAEYRSILLTESDINSLCKKGVVLIQQQKGGLVTLVEYLRGKAELDPEVAEALDAAAEELRVGAHDEVMRQALTFLHAFEAPNCDLVGLGEIAGKIFFPRKTAKLSAKVAEWQERVPRFLRGLATMLAGDLATEASPQLQSAAEAFLKVASHLEN